MATAPRNLLDGSSNMTPAKISPAPTTNENQGGKPQARNFAGYAGQPRMPRG